MSRNARSCDACRVAKVGCITRSRLRSGPLRVDSLEASTGAAAAPSTCERCIARDRQCTFSLPVKRRGPRSKQERLQASPFSTFSVTDWSLSSPSTTTDDASPAESHNSLEHDASVPSPLHGAYGPEAAAIATAAAPSSSRWVLSTDRICSRPIFDVMIQDWMQLQYPLMPLVHRPTFRRDLDAGKEAADAGFFSLLVAMCAAVVANIPSIFYKYKTLDGVLPYQTRSEMVNGCHDVVMQLRGPEYFDQTTHEKWSIAYLLGIAHGNLNHMSRSLMFGAEADHHIREIQYHQRVHQQPLPAIELQLHRKAICLSTIGYFHKVGIDPNQPAIFNEDRTLSLNDLKDGLLEVDDENILADEVLPQPEGQTSLTTGLKVLCRLYDLASETRQLSKAMEARQAAQAGGSGDDASPLAQQQQRQRLELLKAAFEKQKHALDDVPQEFDEWTMMDGSARHEADPTAARQFEIMRANIRVTHLWLQSLIFEDIVSLSTDGIRSTTTETEVSASLRRLWDDRENICRQLLHVLYNISHDNLEPNGASLVHKIRVVAATLVDCPFELQGSIARQAHSYIQAFANVLSTLDGTHDTAYSLDLWTTLDQHERRAVSDFSLHTGFD